MPRVSVIMPVYNGEQFLDEAIKSILEQTFRDFEFIIIDDASTDDSLEIIQKWQARDERIIILQNKKNQGVARSLNRGIAKAQGEYIARMDADDISLPKRLELQVNYLDENPHISILGTSMRFFGNAGIKLDYQAPSKKTVFTKLLFATPFAHPTVMLRKSILGDTPYDENLLAGQDYALWWRLLNAGCQGDNLKLPLLRYRKHNQNYSLAAHSRQPEGIKMIHGKVIEYLELNPTAKHLSCHYALATGRKEKDCPAREIKNWIKIFWSVAKQNDKLSRPYLRKMLLALATRYALKNRVISLRFWIGLMRWYGGSIF